MAPRKVRAHCSFVRLAKRREGLGVRSLADPSNLHTGCRAFVFDGTKLLHDKTQGRTMLRDALMLRTLELQQNKNTIERLDGQAMVPR